MARAREATAEAVAATAAVVVGGRRGVEGPAMQHRGDGGNDRRVMARNRTWSSDGPARSSETRSLAPPCTISGARTGTGGPSGADRADHRASCGLFRSTCPGHTSDTRIRAVGPNCPSRPARRVSLQCAGHCKRPGWWPRALRGWPREPWPTATRRYQRAGRASDAAAMARRRRIRPTMDPVRKLIEASLARPV